MEYQEERLLAFFYFYFCALLFAAILFLPAFYSNAPLCFMLVWPLPPSFYLLPSPLFGKS
jgi:hypothetical protein